jgi:uncharacterized membrane protein YfcA
MEYDLTVFNGSLLILSGLIAGFINTMAGGGSMLTLPALMILGMPADIANGTNRISVLLQSVAGAGRYRQKGKLDPKTILPTLFPALTGSLVGALLASYLPVTWLEPTLLVTMIIMAFTMVLQPAIVAPPPGNTAYTLKERPLPWAGPFTAGVYAGFVQAGPGLILIAALAGGLRYDLVRANALKMAIGAALTVVALTVFILRGQVLWVPGLVLALGSVAGAVAGVGLVAAVAYAGYRALRGRDRSP